MDENDQTNRVLLLSRRVPPLERWQCTGWEFERTILAVDDAERLVPARSALARTLERPTRGVARFAPQVRHVPLGRGNAPSQNSYALGFAAVGYLGELLALGPPRAWRRRCDVAVCYVEDFFVSYLPYLKEQIRVLEDFDFVFCLCAGTARALSERLRTPVLHLPSAVDTLRFLPHRDFGQRAVDVTSLGRRSPETHAALLQYAERTGGFYYFDSLSASRMWAPDPDAHRALLARIIGNSRFFIANRAYFDRPDKIDGQEEIGFRFFEGAAAGAVLVGTPPQTAEFRTLFDWEDAVIPAPPHHPAIAETLEDLADQPERLAAISRRNVRHALVRHDWAHRWQTVLDTVGMAATPRLTAHLARLQSVADCYEAGARKVSLSAVPM